MIFQTRSKRGSRKLRNSKKSIWTILLSSGLIIAVFSFITDKAWEIFRHRSIGPQYVKVSIRLENDTLLLFVRNNSDDPLDLVWARIEISEPSLITGQLGVYPDVSKIYEVSSLAGPAELKVIGNQLVVDLHIAQAIDPGKADNFGLKLYGLLGTVNLSKAKIHAELRDTEQNLYTTNY